MQGQTLPQEIYFLGRCDQKGHSGNGFGEVAIKFQSEDLPERAGDLYLSGGGRINRPAEGIFDLLLLTLAEPAEGEPWPRWDEIFEPFANPYVQVEELGRVQLLREGSHCNVGTEKVTRSYTFTVSAQLAPRDAADFDALMRDDHDESAVRCRRLLALTLAGQHKVMLALRSVQQELDLDGDAGGGEGAADERQGNLGV